jgi:FdhD protein
MAVTTTRRAVIRVRDGISSSVPDDLAVEAPLTLALGPEVLATLMRTPGHDLELAAGWLLVESGVERPEHIATMREIRDLDADRVQISLREQVRPPRPRAFVTSAACGVCSTDVLDLSLLASGPLRSPGFTISRSVLADLPEQMRPHQRAFARTGGIHAAALATVAGELLVVREDVGRHNAIDKVNGWALMQGLIPATDHLLVVSSRVSFEIVQKAVAAGLAGIVAVSAPSSLAVDLCREYGLFIAGLVRPGRMNVYAGADLIVD